ncbi:methyltransferase domain-containing protein [Pelagicoccus sp. SDUM812002]|uniref:class I SAM-dependent methyltransferase n=1 Tax=Pelagicoccus sp. SDUM812002 TaxID=3041266 RepID=UPI00280CCB88|nr:methyltransferase domain-containing protein [Pelagicoccus sp. SDUM812002]MDQ8185918.1 methyltransferase domain-containing protein [Pelagicoccus sp. SDUM812002]
MNRTQKILSLIQSKGEGLEIGPCHAPVAPKSEGFNVKVIDHADRPTLIEKYTGHGVDLEKIEDVDYVWNGESYRELIGSTNHFDWIIASHVVEHTPDFISFLKDCSGLLKPSGVLALAIPDKRLCFDHFRPITGLSRIIDAHYEKRTRHSPGSNAEFYLNAISKGGKLGWDESETGEIEFIHSPAEAQIKMRESMTASDYQDLHSWCFTLDSFRLLVHDLNSLGLSDFKETQCYPTDGCEFIIGLSKHGSGIPCDRTEFLRSFSHEY